jgi:hypothetical protein
MREERRERGRQGKKEGREDDEGRKKGERTRKRKKEKVPLLSLLSVHRLINREGAIDVVTPLQPSVCLSVSLWVSQVRPTTGHHPGRGATDIKESG